jgi:transcription antitermination factor NusG
MDGLAEKAWYCVEAVEGQDSKACLGLAVAGLVVWRPFDTRRAAGRQGDGARARQGKPVVKTVGAPRADRSRPRFGRYFFVYAGLTECIFQEIQHAPGVRGFVCATGSRFPVPIPPEQIEFLRASPPPVQRSTTWRDWGVLGSQVEITQGPLHGRTALIRGIDQKGIFELELILFGRFTRVIAEASHVSQAVQAKPDNSRKTVLNPAGHLVSAAAA